ncbi:hypothetical protein DY000_02053577 [Brassica cretica]|uniref:Uncharacterized protein n=1 Tax=Brassica cretica TaxID=69181 RepID=A0ABQ7A572_BRACR|nr:hypothetical protein DY000_02053577 [Brassica cretica]
MVMGWDRVRNDPWRTGRARRASRSVARSSSPVSQPATRPSSPGNPFRLFVFSAFEVLTKIWFSAGRAMDSGITLLPGAVAFASDSESLFVEPSGVL